MNAELNLRLVAATTNRFIFQIIDSLMQSWGLRLTCLDCNNSHNLLSWLCIDDVRRNGHWSLLEFKGFSLNFDVAWETSWHFAMHQRSLYEMTPEERHQDLGSASDWLKICFGFMEISAVFLKLNLNGKTTKPARHLVSKSGLCLVAPDALLFLLRLDILCLACEQQSISGRRFSPSEK